VLFLEAFIARHIHTIASIGFVMIAAAYTLIRIKAADKPTNAKKILMPPIGMSTGFLMFLYQPTHIPWLWAIVAFLCGAIFFSIPLIKTSTFELRNGQVFLKRSRAFIVILISLVTARFVLHSYIEKFLSIPQTASIFFILAFGMLVPWRISMYIQYQKLRKKHDIKEEALPST
jgi:membrane protein CcdC involved in cytochrome C biogenesis